MVWATGAHPPARYELSNDVFRVRMVKFLPEAKACAAPLNGGQAVLEDGSCTELGSGDSANMPLDAARQLA